jgi:uncharacterized protein YktB (UPF0637 family)
LGSDGQILTRQYPYNIHELYDKYSGMLFGYIYEVVKDTNLAEQLLVSFYATIKDHLHELNADGANTWCQLQRLLKNHLSTSEKPIERDVMISHSGNKYLGMMSNEQKYVFYHVYYHGRSTAELSYILNKPEELVRKNLKEAFAILRQRT